MVKNKVSAATTAAIATTTIPTGLAVIAKLNAVWAAVAILVPTLKAICAALAIFEVWANFANPLTAPAKPSPADKALVTIPKVLAKLPSTLIPPPTAPVILLKLVKKVPMPVIAGPMTGLKPIKPRVTFAIELFDSVDHSKVLLIISSIAPLTPDLEAIALFLNDSQLPPTCSIFEPIFFCISLA